MATSKQPSQQPAPSLRLADLPDEWQVPIRTLRVSFAQLVIRLAAMEKSGAIGPEVSKAYVQWIERVRGALEMIPQE